MPVCVCLHISCSVYAFHRDAQVSNLIMMHISLALDDSKRWLICESVKLKWVLTLEC